MKLQTDAIKNTYSIVHSMMEDLPDTHRSNPYKRVEAFDHAFQQFENQRNDVYRDDPKNSSFSFFDAGRFGEMPLDISKQLPDYKGPWMTLSELEEINRETPIKNFKDVPTYEVFDPRTDSKLTLVGIYDLDLEYTKVSQRKYDTFEAITQAVHTNIDPEFKPTASEFSATGAVQQLYKLGWENGASLSTKDSGYQRLDVNHKKLAHVLAAYYAAEQLGLPVTKQHRFNTPDHFNAPRSEALLKQTINLLNHESAISKNDFKIINHYAQKLAGIHVKQVREIESLNKPHVKDVKETTVDKFQKYINAALKNTIQIFPKLVEKVGYVLEAPYRDFQKLAENGPGKNANTKQEKTNDVKKGMER